MFNEVEKNHQVLLRWFIRPFLFPMLFFLLMCSSTYVNADTFDCNGLLYSDALFSEEKESFSIFDKVYLKITCNGLSAGNYNITSSWINSHGEIKRQNNHSFELLNASNHMSYSWIKLLRRGHFKRIITGQDFNVKEYGQWTVAAYMNGKEIVSKDFMLN